MRVEGHGVGEATRSALTPHAVKLAVARLDLELLWMTVYGKV